MTIEYKDSKRIVASGIGTELTGIGGWVEVGRTTLGVAGGTISVSSLPNKRYYKVIHNALSQSGSADPKIRFNGDSSGNHYAWRRSVNGTEGTNVSQNEIFFISQPSGSNPSYGVFYVSNLSGKEKLVISNNASPTGYTDEAPARTEVVGKWAPATASDVINEISVVNATNFAVGSEVIVLGWDPDDTHTTNFWEELTSVESNSNSTTIDTGTFTAKKYLWIQGVINLSTGNTTWVRANSDNNNNYDGRGSLNGGSDTTRTGSSETGMRDTIETASGRHFINMYVLNNITTVKLFLSHVVHQGTDGANNYPNRRVGARQWSNTNTQVTSLQFTNDASNDILSGSTLKVWGSN